MLSSLLTSAALLAAAVLPLAEGAPALIEDRGICNSDNLLRLLRASANLPEAIPFCSSYLGLPASTVVAGTVTPTGTKYSTHVDTLSPTATSLTTKVDSIQPTVTQSTTAISTSTDSRTVTSETTTVTTVTVAAAARRAAKKTPLSQQVTETYDAGRISSACLCLTIPYSLVTVTATAASATKTLTVETTSTAPEATVVQTILSTTTLPAATETLTLQSTTGLPVTTTVVSLVTSTSTTRAAPAPSPTFQLFLEDNHFLANRDDSPANNNAQGNTLHTTQVLSLVRYGSMATLFTLTPEGYLSIVRTSSSFVSAPLGQESLNWVMYDQPFVPLFSARLKPLADLQACGRSCSLVPFKFTSGANGFTYLTPSVAGLGRQFYTCTNRDGSGVSLYFGDDADPFYSCTLTRLVAFTV